MAKILILYTGGTIGMDQGENGLAPKPGLLETLLAQRGWLTEEITFVEWPELIDSSCITPKHWNQLLHFLYKEYAHYDGFVVLHGTDTLAYTSSVLAFALQGLSKPVVLTGSMLPLIYPRSDGWDNLANALAAVQQRDLHEVVIAFGRQLLRGCRARKLSMSGATPRFDSPNAPALAYFDSEIVWQRHRWITHAIPSTFTPCFLDETLNIAAFFLMPGYSAEYLGRTLLQNQLHAAIILSYGAGNAPADPILLEGIRHMTQQEKLVINLTQVPYGKTEATYEAAAPLLNAGALPGMDLTPEAALAKLLILLSEKRPFMEQKIAMRQSLVGEMDA